MKNIRMQIQNNLMDVTKDIIKKFRSEPVMSKVLFMAPQGKINICSRVCVKIGETMDYKHGEG